MTTIALKDWKKKVTQRFTAHRDLRGLIAIEHPWSPSRAGGYGAWEARVTPPDDWSSGQRLFVSFYQSDNYSGTWQPCQWTGTQAFIGHRFKQLLVNGRVVWEQDVADEEVAGSVASNFNLAPSEAGHADPFRVVDISAHAQRDLVLTFRVIDKVASTVKLPGDAYKRFAWSTRDPNEAVKNFQTSVYFGDVTLSLDGQIARPPESAPVPRTKVSTPRRFPAGGVSLELVGPSALPSPGYPVRSSVPLPQGAADKRTPFGLRDPAGRVIAVATSEISHWPDGSVRWLLCEFVAQRKGRYRLIANAAPVRPKHPVHVSENATQINNSRLTLQLGNGSQGVFEGISCRGALDLGAMDFAIKLNRVGWRDHYTARRRSIRIERSNDVCAVVLVEGDMLDDADRRFGSWRARLHLWAELPYLLVDWRLVNESDQAMAMLMDWSARVRLPDLAGAVVDFGPFTPGADPEDLPLRAIPHEAHLEAARAIPLHADLELSCRQERADQARIYRNTAWAATAARAPGFVNLKHQRGGVAAAMRWFAEEFPKGIVVRPDSLKLATMPESEDAMSWQHDRPFVRIGRGEAKRQSFAIWLHDGSLGAAEAQRFNACVQDVPRLFNRSWFIDSRAIECGAARDLPRLKEWAKKVTPIIERTGIALPRLGHREYWDTAWSNDYRGRTHLGLIQYLETADPRWYRYFDAACTHNRDVDVIHYCPEHPDWVGANHTFGEDHTSTGPTGNISSNCDGMLEHYLLTGDPDSLEAARGFAERLLSCNTQERSARCVGWPLAQVVRWYDQTGDERFARKADAFLKAAHAYIEPRRGIFTETHGCFNYRGPVTFMSGYLAFGLIRYHQRFQDELSLRLLKLLADGLFAEGRVAKGRFQYSPFPENNFMAVGAGKARSFNALTGGLAGYLHQVTGEKIYADWAQECYDGIVEDSKDPQVPMDMLPIAGWMLHAVADGAAARSKKPSARRRRIRASGKIR